MPAVLIAHEEDPGHKIFRNAGDLDEIEVFNNQVLVGVYERPENSRTKTGIVLPYQTTDEDKFQSKVGVILKMGPSAFHDKNGVWFANATFNVGDWVGFRANDGWGLKLVSVDPRSGEKREQLCRLMPDTSVLLRVACLEPADRIY